MGSTWNFYGEGRGREVSVPALLSPLESSRNARKNELLGRDGGEGAVSVAKPTCLANRKPHSQLWASLMCWNGPGMAAWDAPELQQSNRG